MRNAHSSEDRESNSSGVGLPFREINQTSQMKLRTGRPANLSAENQALQNLAETLASSPEIILSRLAEEAMLVCGGSSAGVSIFEELEGKNIFRWHAACGDAQKFVGHTIECEASPCNLVLSQKSQLLLRQPARSYSYIKALGVPVEELLIVPFGLEGQTRGTLWVSTSSPSKNFDSEDSRILHVLARFALAAIQIKRQLKLQTDSRLLLENAMSALATEKHKFETLISLSPAAIALMRGPESVFEIVNDPWKELVSERVYIGRKYADIYPELVGTAAEKSIHDVYRSGVSYVANEMKLLVQVRPQVFEDRYYDYTCIQILDGTGQPYGVYCHALNVTERVLNRKSREEAELRIRTSEEQLTNAVAVSKVGFYDWNMVTDHITFSEQMQRDWQFDSNCELADALNRIHPDDRSSTTKLIDRAPQS